MCCEKRFRPNEVDKLTPPPRTTLYKYLIIPKEGPTAPPSGSLPSHPPPPVPKSYIDPPRTPTEETRPTINPFVQRALPHSPQNEQQPPEIKRRTSHSSSVTEHEMRPRSGTLPFIEQTEPLQQMSSMRSGHGAKTNRRIQHAVVHDEGADEAEDQ